MSQSGEEGRMVAGSRNTVSLAAKIKNFQNYSSSCLVFLKHCKGGIWFWTTLPKTPFLSHLFPSPAAALSVLSLSQLLEKIFLLLSSSRAGPCSSSCIRVGLGPPSLLDGQETGEFGNTRAWVVDVLSWEVFSLFSRQRNWGMRRVASLPMIMQLVWGKASLNSTLNF